jgi:hypothetical protein
MAALVEQGGQGGRDPEDAADRVEGQPDGGVEDELHAVGEAGRLGQRRHHVPGQPPDVR